jgi:hypothetical protein
MGDPVHDRTNDSLTIEGLEDVFDLSGTSKGTAGTEGYSDPGQPGQDTIEATGVSTYISTAEAAKLANVDSRTIRRWYGQKKVRGQFSKGKLLIAHGDILSAAGDPPLFAAGTPGTESGTSTGTAGTDGQSDPGQPGYPDLPQTPAVAFADFLDRIERLSRENGELKAMLDEQRRENQKLLTDSQHKQGPWSRFWGWFMGRG